MCQIRPVEVIQEREAASGSVAKMLKNSPVVPTFTNLNPQKCYSVTKTLTKCEQIFGGQQPELLMKLRSEEKEFALQTLGMTIAFLEDALIAQKTLSTG